MQAGRSGLIPVACGLQSSHFLNRLNHPQVKVSDDICSARCDAGGDSLGPQHRGLVVVWTHIHPQMKLELLRLEGHPETGTSPRWQDGEDTITSGVWAGGRGLPATPMWGWHCAGTDLHLMLQSAPMPEHSQGGGQSQEQHRTEDGICGGASKAGGRRHRGEKNPISQGNPDPGLSRALSTPRLSLLFNTDLKQPLNVVGLCFRWLQLPDLLLGFHASQSDVFQGQPLLTPKPCIPFAWLASPLGTTDPRSSHSRPRDRHLTGHIAIPFIAIAPCSASVLRIQFLPAFTCLVLKQGVHQLGKGEDRERKELLLE